MAKVSVGGNIFASIVIGVIGYAGSYETPSNFTCRVSDWRQLEPGDVIVACRKPIKGINTYDHYGIYAGNLEVIHFSDGRKHFSGEVPVRKDSFYQFKDEDEVFVVDVDGFNEYIKNLSPLKIGQRIHDSIRKYHFYSPEETLMRAESRVGKVMPYDLKKNNCEHFAIWCKTGVAESSQAQIANRMLKMVNPIPSRISRKIEYDAAVFRFPS